MRILICTQKVDRDDPVLGFFHRWIIEFAKRFESVIVICLGEGRHDLPANVRVLSLGKEKFGPGNSDAHKRRVYARKFRQYIRDERANYDLVFVHMNQEYVLLGGIKWKLWSKKVFLWRNHVKGSALTRIAVALSDRVFCTSPSSFTAQFKRAIRMPVGIDTDHFRRLPGRSDRAKGILVLSRISPVKKVEVMIKGVAELKKMGVVAPLAIIGDPTVVDAEYFKAMKALVADSGLGGQTTWKPAVKNDQTVACYNEWMLSVNATPSGSFDKTIFEAMACEELALTSNAALVGVLDPRLIFKEGDSHDLALKIKGIFDLNASERLKLERAARDIVVKQHSLSSLVEKVRALAEHEISSHA